MPLPLDEKKKGSIVSIILKKVRGGDSYDGLKGYNEEIHTKKMVDGAEQEQSQSAQQAAADRVMESLKASDSQAFLSSMRGLISMLYSEMDKD